MNQIAPYTEPQIGALLTDDGVSSLLWHALRLCAEPHPDIGRPKSFHAVVQTEAQGMADRLDAACQPAGPRFVTEWVKVIVYGITSGNRLSDQEAAARLAAIVMALQDLAVGAFTEEARRSIVRSCRFAPSAAELYDTLAPRAHALTSRRDMLRYIAAAGTEPVHPPAGNVVALRPRALPAPQKPERTVEQQLAALRGA